MAKNAGITRAPGIGDARLRERGPLLVDTDEELRARVEAYEATAGKPHATRAPEREAMTARVVELAREVSASDRKGRQRFIRSLGTRAWIKGETIPALAALWQRATSTIEIDASVAWNAVLVAADDDDRRVFWAEVHANLEAATGARNQVLEVLEQVPIRNASDLRSVGEAARATVGAVDQGLLTLGRASGVISSDGNKVRVSIVLDDRGNVRPEIASLLEVIRGALEPYPEAGAAVSDALDVWIRDMVQGELE